MAKKDLKRREFIRNTATGIAMPILAHDTFAETLWGNNSEEKKSHATEEEGVQQDTQARIKFLTEIEIAEPRKIKGELLKFKAATNGARSGYVNDGSLVSFVAGVDKQFQEDVLNSTLLAQLAANKKFDREQDSRNWYTFYKTVLENVGWTLQGFGFTQFNVSGGSFSCDKAVLEILTAITR